MKRTLTTICAMALAGAAGAAGAAVLSVDLMNLISANATNRNVQVTLLTQPRVEGGRFVIREPVSVRSDTNGNASFTNIVWGYYRIDVSGTPSSSFNIWVSTNNAASSDILIASTLVTNAAPSNVTNYYTADQVDTLLQAIEVGGVVAGQNYDIGVTNSAALGGVLAEDYATLADLVGATNGMLYESDALNLTNSANVFAGDGSRLFNLMSNTNNVMYKNTVFVSAAYGNNSTAVVGEPTRPYATLNVASAAVPASGFIYVSDGNYAEIVTNSKACTWYFANGTTAYGFIGGGWSGEEIVPVTNVFLYGGLSIAGNGGLHVGCGMSNLVVELDSVTGANCSIGGYGDSSPGSQLTVKCRKLSGNGSILYSSLSKLRYEASESISGLYYIVANGTNQTLSIKAPVGADFQFQEVSSAFHREVDYFIECDKYYAGNGHSIFLLNGSHLTFKNTDILSVSNQAIVDLFAYDYIEATVPSTNHVMLDNVRFYAPPAVAGSWCSGGGLGSLQFHFRNVVANREFVPYAWDGAYEVKAVSGTVTVDPEWNIAP